MLRTLVCESNNSFREETDTALISDLLSDKRRHIWLDLEAPDEEDFRMIAEEFGLHPLAIEDAHLQHQRPKVEQYDGFYFVVFYSVDIVDAETGERPPGRLGLAHSSLPHIGSHEVNRANGATEQAQDGAKQSSTQDAKPDSEVRRILTPTARRAAKDAQPANNSRSGPRSGRRRADEAAAQVEERIILRELAMFMGSNYLITVHADPIPELAEAERRWRANAKTLARQDAPDSSGEQQGDQNGKQPTPAPQGPEGMTAPQPGVDDIGILLYSLIDTIVDDYFPVIDSIVDRVENLEEQIFEQFDQRALQSIFALKKDLLSLRKVLAPERDVLNILTRRDLPLFNSSTILYFQDIYDHVVRITDSIDTYRDLLSSALDSFLSVQSNRLNITVQTLTSASIILMTVTLVAGIYGMNFDNMPELHWTFGYFYALVLMVVIAVGLYYFFKRKGWL